MRTKLLVRVCHSRGTAVVLGILAVIGGLTAWWHGAAPTLHADDGIIWPPADLWLSSGTTAMSVSMALTAITAYLSVILSREFNLMRGTSVLHVGIFMVMQAANPSVIDSLTNGTILALVLIICQFTLFPVFHRPDATRPVFLMFLILSLGAMSGMAYIWFLPVMLIGLIQMRALNPRSITASVLGMVTVPWILIGMGITSPETFRWPEFGPCVSAGAIMADIPAAVAIGLSILMALTFGFGSMLTTYGYNSRGRAYNGFIDILTIATIVLIIADYAHFPAYADTLNLCAAYQAGHFFTTHNRSKSYIAIAGIVALYTAIYFRILLW